MCGELYLLHSLLLSALQPHAPLIVNRKICLTLLRWIVYLVLSIKQNILTKAVVVFVKTKVFKLELIVVYSKTVQLWRLSVRPPHDYEDIPTPYLHLQLSCFCKGYILRESKTNRFYQ